MDDVGAADHVDHASPGRIVADTQIETRRRPCHAFGWKVAIRRDCDARRLRGRMAEKVFGKSQPENWYWAGGRWRERPMVWHRHHVAVYRLTAAATLDRCPLRLTAQDCFWRTAQTA